MCVFLFVLVYFIIIIIIFIFIFLILTIDFKSNYNDGNLLLRAPCRSFLSSYLVYLVYE